MNKREKMHKSHGTITDEGESGIFLCNTEHCVKGTDTDEMGHRTDVQAIISVQGISFTYQTVKVLENIRISISRGEIVAILGPNGVGKSTLLKCMNLILKPTGGAIMLSDLNLAHISPKEIAKKMGYVSQRSESSRMTVYDSVLLGRKPHIGWNISDHDYDVVETALDQFGLAEMEMRYIDELSGGELQRVCICRAIVQEPHVLLLDEPTSSLDLCRQMEILQVIRNVVETHHVATVMTMHDLNLAVRFADRFIFMKEGKILASCEKNGINPDIIKCVYGVDVDIIMHKQLPVVVPA